MENLGLILIAFFVGWFWLDSLRAREIAIGICSTACQQRGVQFLDQTVALRRLGVRWTQEGIRLRRVYRFDYSEEGFARVSGHLVMLGLNMEELSMGLPQRSGDA